MYQNRISQRTLQSPTMEPESYEETMSRIEDWIPHSPTAPDSNSLHCSEEQGTPAFRDFESRPPTLLPSSPLLINNLFNNLKHRSDSIERPTRASTRTASPRDRKANCEDLTEGSGVGLPPPPTVQNVRTPPLASPAISRSMSELS